MKNYRTITLLLLAAVPSSMPAKTVKCAPDSSKNDHLGAAGTCRIIPIKIYSGYLVLVEGQIAGVSGPQNFVLDTGTSPSIINERLVRHLKLATKPSSVIAAGRTVITQSTIVPEITLGPIHAGTLRMNVQDLSQAESDFDVPIAGIIGFDVLTKSSFRLDYAKKQLEFGEMAHPGIPVSFDPETNISVAGVSLAGKMVRMIVDTGTDRVVILAGNFTEVSWLQPRETSQYGKNVAGEDSKIQIFSARDLVLGGEHFSTARAYLVAGGQAPQFDGLLGVRALGFHGLSYDQSVQTIYLEK
jgi:hypothetical protein